MALKWSKIIDLRDAFPNNIFKFTTSYTKTLEDGTTKTFTYNIDIPDMFAKIYCGDKKVSKVLKQMYDDDSVHFITSGLPAVVSTVAENFQYQIGAIIESNTLYFNPLWNVDGTEKVTEDRAKRERNVTNDYGNNTPYTLSIQYGKDTNTAKYGNNATYTETLQYGETTDTHKTNPFNDSTTDYTTDKEISATHTDTTTYNPHTDVNERDQHTDTTTYNPHTDKEKVADDAFKDVITTERHGNIGVTKSTELLRDARELPTEMYAPILDFMMKYLSRGY